MSKRLMMRPSVNHARSEERVHHFSLLSQRSNAVERRTEESEILFVSSFPPRECGIATYTQDLINAVHSQFSNRFRCEICALELDATHHRYPSKPAYILQTNDRNEFVKAAFRINRNARIKLVVVQHEFGLFSANEEAFQLFLEQLIKPVVLVFHTVLPAPDAEHKRYVVALSEAVAAIIVMTSHAAKILEADYGIAAAHMHIIPHGTHLLPFVDRKKLKVQFGFGKKKVLTTFGLLGPGKSIETTLRALPAVLAKAPDTIFLILGKTHPGVVREAGEAYRQQLEKMVQELGLSAVVHFVNEYLPLPQLLNYLQLTDIYVFSANNPHQAVSGTFAYAVSSGCPIVSTPIPHAREVLANNNGIIFDFNNHSQLSEAIIKLLGNDALRKQMAINGLQQMAATAWNNAALAHGRLFHELTHGQFALRYRIPPINLQQLTNLTTDFGLLQFSHHAVPDHDSGYTVDDNARALIAICEHYSLFRGQGDLELASTYLRYLEHCLLPDGQLLNYVDRARQFSLQNFHENLNDSTGRAIWALGYVCSLSAILPDFFILKAQALLEKVLPALLHIHSTRAMAFAIKGLYLENNPQHLWVLETLAIRLRQMYLHEQSADWIWFEPYLTYGNSVLPEAMLCAHLRLEQAEYKTIAVQSFDFLLSKLFIGETFRAISNQGWLQRNRVEAAVQGGEQPIDVAYTIMALVFFDKHVGGPGYLEQANIAFAWFLGNNHLQKIMYNPVTGGCYDGLEAHDVNINQGAESTVSYLLARLALEKVDRMRLQGNQLSRLRLMSSDAPHPA
jgi:glycosyltransferase involved in cell wall biosynthesis